MKSKSQASSKRTSSSKGGGDEGTSSQSKGEPNLGSLIWIKFNGNSWWPAQVQKTTIFKFVCEEKITTFFVS